MKIFVAVLSFLLLFSCGSSTYVYDPPKRKMYPGVIKGTVTDSEGKLLRNALIDIEGRKLKVRTDENGKFVIRGLKKGEYRIQCNMEGFSEKIKEEVTVKQQYTTVINFVLKKK